MSVLLSAIQFNHDVRSKISSALNVRKNASEFVSVPEWRRNVSYRPEDSVAAYSIEDTRHSTVIIKAEFLRKDTSISSVQIRAVQLPNPSLPLWVRFLPHPDLLWPQPHYYYSYYDLLNYNAYKSYFEFWQAWLVTSSNVLGEVKPRVITFRDNNKSGMRSFELQNVRLSSRYVGVSNVEWLWQYRINSTESWRDMLTTRHRIYSLLSLPTEPWKQSPYRSDNTALLWTDVLDFSCHWASGSMSRLGATQRITRAINELGGSIFEYGCPVGSVEMYSNALFNIFDCSATIERLRGDIGNGRYVNCSDCASMVSTFANSLGCDLWQSRMGKYVPTFATNPIRAIGTEFWGSPCGWGLGFTFHEVAWTGDCDSDNEIFDASLEVNGSAIPAMAPHIPLLPSNMRFGLSGDGQYRDRLAAPRDRLICEPIPGERRRRRLV